jgi:hypothetical protein
MKGFRDGFAMEEVTVDKLFKLIEEILNIARSKTQLVEEYYDRRKHCRP